MLNQRKNYIKSNTDILTSGFALASYITTMVFTVVGMEKIPLFAKIIGLAMLVFYIGMFFWSICYSRYSVEAFYRDITSCSKNHNFSLLKNKENIQFVEKYF